MKLIDSIIPLFNSKVAILIFYRVLKNYDVISDSGVPIFHHSRIIYFTERISLTVIVLLYITLMLKSFTLCVGLDVTEPHFLFFHVVRFDVFILEFDIGDTTFSVFKVDFFIIIHVIITAFAIL